MLHNTKEQTLRVAAINMVNELNELGVLNRPQFIDAMRRATRITYDPKSSQDLFDVLFGEDAKAVVTARDEAEMTIFVLSYNGVPLILKHAFLSRMRRGMFGTTRENLNKGWEEMIAELQDKK
jgi:hypothetical protein